MEALSTIRWIRNTFAPINKLHPELLASITTFVDDPSGENRDCADIQFVCATICRHWRNSLLAFPRIWSSIDTANSRRLKLYLARSKKAPLHVSYGWTTPYAVFEQNIVPERHRLQSLSIPICNEVYPEITRSLAEPSESLRTLDMRVVRQPYSIAADKMGTISRFAPNLTVLKLHDITTNLSSLGFPALVKFTFRTTAPDIQTPDAADLIGFLRHCPLLEDLDLYLPESFKVDTSPGTATLARLKYAVFNGSPTPNNSISVNILPYLMLPKQSITVDVQTKARAFSPGTSPLLSVLQLRNAILSQQSITGAVIHIKDAPTGFFGHASVCGEHNNWIGLNHVRVLNIGGSPFSRLGNWLDPVSLAPLSGIQTLTLGLLDFPSEEEQYIEVLRAFLRGLDRVRVLNTYMVDVSLLARVLKLSDGAVLLPLLEVIKFHTYGPPELTRCVAYDKGECGILVLKD